MTNLKRRRQNLSCLQTSSVKSLPVQDHPRIQCIHHRKTNSCVCLFYISAVLNIKYYLTNISKLSLCKRHNLQRLSVKVKYLLKQLIFIIPQKLSYSDILQGNFTKLINCYNIWKSVQEKGSSQSVLHLFRRFKL